MGSLTMALYSSANTSKLRQDSADFNLISSPVVPRAGKAHYCFHLRSALVITPEYLDQLTAPTVSNSWSGDTPRTSGIESNVTIAHFQN